MANYTQQCRGCSMHIEGTGEDICYRCLQKERDKYRDALYAMPTRSAMPPIEGPYALALQIRDRRITELEHRLVSLEHQVNRRYR